MSIIHIHAENTTRPNVNHLRAHDCSVSSVIKKKGIEESSRPIYSHKMAGILVSVKVCSFKELLAVNQSEINEGNYTHGPTL